MTADLRAHLDRLDTALAAATPGPWRRNSQPGVIFGNGGDRPMPIAAGYTRPDAALIVAAVNALPGLLAAVRAAADLADEWLRDGSAPQQALALRTALAAALPEGDQA